MNLCFTGQLLLMLPCVAVAQQQSVFEKLRQQANSNTLSSQLQSADEKAFRQRYQQQLAEYKARYLEEFAQFKARYNQQLAEYRQQLLGQWGEVDISDNSKAVVYPQQDVKAVVDFEQGQIEISVIHDQDSQVPLAKVTEALAQLQEVKPTSLGEPSPTKASALNLLSDFADASQLNYIISNPDEVISNAKQRVESPQIDQQDIAQEEAFLSRQARRDQHQLERIADHAELDQDKLSTVKQGLDTANQKTRRNSLRIGNDKLKRPSGQLTKKRITRFRLPVKGKPENQKIDSVMPHANLYAQQWQLPTELIVAVIHTESSFYPEAESHIPAFGLMQVVPGSAGIDVNQFLHNSSLPLSKQYLFDVRQNIEAGTAYLHLLDQRYLSKVSNNTSRLYCVIAAYNTGVGNVARAFSGGKTRRLEPSVVDRINGMTPQQVYDQLLRHLPYEETRRYLQKVDQRMQHYGTVKLTST